MELLEAIKNRHSVRNYLDKPIPESLVKQLQEEVDACNQESGLHIQLVTNEPKAFDGMMAHYGKFSGVQNYIALIGKKGDNLEEEIGYYGERVALKAQTLGLNTCWVAMTFSKGVTKKNCVIHQGEKLVCVLSLGYGKTQGVPHTSKSLETLCSVPGDMPKWFRNGMEAALLAPTASNQQKFFLTLKDDTVSIKSLGGFYSKVDLGIIKYHFEVGTEHHPFSWS
ncbi:MAG TPA: nitroreductase [Candidatus Merdenecus merdavium]|nr:nitroreductase [Candidatus Merdenecus merdavium]